MSFFLSGFSFFLVKWHLAQQNAKTHRKAVFLKKLGGEICTFDAAAWENGMVDPKNAIFSISYYALRNCNNFAALAKQCI